MNASNVTVLALLWAVILWRSPAAMQPPLKRAPWLAFTFLAVALTADLPPVIRLIDRASGVSDLSVLVKHLAMVAAGAAVLDWVMALRPPGRAVIRPVQAAAVAVTATLIVLWLVMPRPETTQFTEVEHGWLAAAYLWVFYAWLAATLAVAAWLFWQVRGTDHPELYRPGMRASVTMLAAGSAAGVVFAVAQAAVLGVRTARLVSPGTGSTLLDGTAIIEDIAIVVTVTGACLPAFATGWQSLTGLRRLRRLRPLWCALTSAAPAVKAEPFHGLAARTVRYGHVRLIRRVVEIRDAARHLAPYVPEQQIAAARARLAAAGVADGDLDAAAEACWLRMAVSAASSDGSPVPGTWHVLPGGRTLGEETTWQLRLADAWSSDVVKTAAGDGTEAAHARSGEAAA